jgi:hypothetical protein
LRLQELVFLVDLIEFLNHLVKFMEILGVILPLAFVRLYLPHLQDGLRKV